MFERHLFIESEFFRPLELSRCVRVWCAQVVSVLVQHFSMQHPALKNVVLPRGIEGNSRRWLARHADVFELSPLDKDGQSTVSMKQGADAIIEAVPHPSSPLLALRFFCGTQPNDFLRSGSSSRERSRPRRWSARLWTCWLGC